MERLQPAAGSHWFHTVKTLSKDNLVIKRGYLPVIVLANLPNSYQCFQVLVGLIGVDVVQWAAVPRITIWGGEIYSYLEKDEKLMYCGALLDTSIPTATMCLYQKGFSAEAAALKQRLILQPASWNLNYDSIDKDA